jgi:hypothetical protein
MRRPIVSILILLAAATPCAVAAPALASSRDVIRDCSEDGKLDKHYSQKELKGALDNLPSDLDEYTDCRTVIRAAQLAGAGHKGGGGKLLGLVGNAPPNASEQKHLDRAARSPGAVSIGGHTVKPGGAGAPFKAAGLGTDLPIWVLAALAALAAAMLGSSMFAFQRRWPNAWQAAGAAIGPPARRLGEGVKRGISRFRR